MSFTNRLNAMKMGRAKMRAYGDGGSVMDEAKRAVVSGGADALTFVPDTIQRLGRLAHPGVSQGYAPTAADQTERVLENNDFVPQTTAGKVGRFAVGMLAPGASKLALEGGEAAMRGGNELLNMAARTAGPLERGSLDFRSLKKKWQDLATDVVEGKQTRIGRLKEISKDYKPTAADGPIELTPEEVLREAKIGDKGKGDFVDKIGLQRSMNGQNMDFRLDLSPGGKKTKAITFHEPKRGEKPGSVIAYDSHALIDSPTYVDAPKTNLGTATKGDKFAGGRFNGNFINTTQDEASALHSEWLKDPTVFQVTFNPSITGIPFTTKGFKAVKGGDQALIVGHTMYIKNPTYLSPEELSALKYAKGGKVEASQRALGYKLFGGLG